MKPSTYSPCSTRRKLHAAQTQRGWTNNRLTKLKRSNALRRDVESDPFLSAERARWKNRNQGAAVIPLVVAQRLTG